jgi:hypothetical protein
MLANPDSAQEDCTASVPHFQPHGRESLQAAIARIQLYSVLTRYKPLAVEIAQLLNYVETSYNGLKFWAVRIVYLFQNV